MYEIVSSLASKAPELFFGLLFISALWIVLREYRRIGAGIKESVQTEVAAQLGRTMGDLRISSEEAGRVQNEIRTLYEEVRKASEEFESRVTNQEVELSRKFQHLRERVAKYEEILPDEQKETKVPATQLANAIQRSSTWVDAAGPVENLKADPDATALDLETAGDRVRGFGQFTLALELYDMSRRLDPERETAAIEYLTLKAERNFEGREEALREAMDIVVANPTEIVFVRLANSLINLDKYGLLQDLCESILARDDIQGRPEIVGLCHKNLGATYRELNRPEQAKEAFRKAYELDPENENFLKGYATHVLSEGEYEEALSLYAKLVRIDPFDGSYFYSMGGILEKLDRIEDAIIAYSYAEKLTDEEEPLSHRASRARARLQVLGDLPDFVSEMQTI